MRGHRCSLWCGASRGLTRRGAFASVGGAVHRLDGEAYELSHRRLLFVSESGKPLSPSMLASYVQVGGLPSALHLCRCRWRSHTADSTGSPLGMSTTPPHNHLCRWWCDLADELPRRGSATFGEPDQELAHRPIVEHGLLWNGQAHPADDGQGAPDVRIGPFDQDVSGCARISGASATTTPDLYTGPPATDAARLAGEDRDPFGSQTGNDPSDDLLLFTCGRHRVTFQGAGPDWLPAAGLGSSFPPSLATQDPQGALASRRHLVEYYTAERRGHKSR